MSKFDDLTGKIAEKILSRAKAKRKRLKKVDNLIMREPALNRHQNQKVNLRNK